MWPIPSCSPLWVQCSQSRDVRVLSEGFLYTGHQFARWSTLLSGSCFFIGEWERHSPLVCNEEQIVREREPGRPEDQTQSHGGTLRSQTVRGTQWLPGPLFIFCPHPVPRFLIQCLSPSIWKQGVKRIHFGS